MDSIDLINAFEGWLSVRFKPVPAPAESLSLLVRPATREQDSDTWEPQEVVSAWSGEEVAQVAAWFARHATPDEPISTEAVWFGKPAIGFRVINRNPEGLALDVCWTHAPDVPRPTLTGGEAVSAGDDRYTYLTIDMHQETVRAAAATWSAWATGASNGLAVP